MLEQKQNTWIACLGITTATLVLMSAAPSLAQAPLDIIGFEAETVGSAVAFVAKTRSGDMIPQESISFKTRRNVIRIDYNGIPLARELGRRVDFNVSQLPRVAKGFAQRERNTRAAVRLKFDTFAERALDGHVIIPVEGGTAILFPFGDLAVASKFVAENTKGLKSPEIKPTPVDEAETPPALADSVKTAAPPVTASDVEGSPREDGYMPAAPGIEEAAAKPGSEPAKQDSPAATKAATRPYKPIFPVGQADLKKTDQTDPVRATEPPLVLAKEGEGPTIGKVAVGLVVVSMLLIVLMFGLRKINQFKLLKSGLALSGDSVKVLSSFPISRTQNIVFIDILGEVIVLGQSPNAINMLYTMDPEKVAELRQKPDEVGGLMSSLFNRTNTTAAPASAAVPETTTNAPLGRDPVEFAGTLEAMARNLEANARAGSARRNFDEEAVETPAPSSAPTNTTVKRVGIDNMTTAQRQAQQKSPTQRSQNITPPAPIYAQRAETTQLQQPIDFSKHLSRMNAQDTATLGSKNDSLQEFPSPLQKSANNPAALSHDPTDDDILNASRAFRARMRSLGRL